MTDKTDDKTPAEEVKPEKAAGWTASAKKPIVAADGHVVLSQEDIDARDQ